MTISVDDSFLADKASDYAKLSDLAYAKMRCREDGVWVVDENQANWENYNNLGQDWGQT